MFIDDLDRCEPENFLNLITSVKLFLSLSDDIIFFLPIDKNAIKNALQHRYNDAIKSEQYLEKVFDVTFNLESEIHYEAILKQYFLEDVEIPNAGGVKLHVFLNNFLKALNFNNPRAVKKLVNKYQLIAWIKYESSIDGKIKSYIPNIYSPNNKEFSILETILTLYVIILHDFHHEVYFSVIDIDGKLIKLTSLNHSIDSRGTYSAMMKHIFAQYFSGIDGINFKHLKLNAEKMLDVVEKNSVSKLKAFYTLFCSKNITSFHINESGYCDYSTFYKTSPEVITTNFFDFFELHMKVLTGDSFLSNYTVSNLFKMVKIVS